MLELFCVKSQCSIVVPLQVLDVEGRLVLVRAMRKSFSFPEAWCKSAIWPLVDACHVFIQTDHRFYSVFLSLYLDAFATCLQFKLNRKARSLHCYLATLYMTVQCHPQAKPSLFKMPSFIFCSQRMLTLGTKFIHTVEIQCVTSWSRYTCKLRQFELSKYTVGDPWWNHPTQLNRISICSAVKLSWKPWCLGSFPFQCTPLTCRRSHLHLRVRKFCHHISWACSDSTVWGSFYLSRKDMICSSVHKRSSRGTSDNCPLMVSIRSHTFASRSLPESSFRPRVLLPNCLGSGYCASVFWNELKESCWPLSLP